MRESQFVEVVRLSTRRRRTRYSLEHSRRRPLVADGG